MRDQYLLVQSTREKVFVYAFISRMFFDLELERVKEPSEISEDVLSNSFRV